MGEVTENFRTFVLPNEDNNYTFNMRFEYDSWNRIQRMIYPDGEEVSYHYNLGGDLYSVDGQKGHERFAYIDSLYYDKFGHKTAAYYGNGTAVNYAGPDGTIGNGQLSYIPDIPRLSEKDLTGATMGVLSTGEAGFTGITLMPDRNGSQNSPDKNIKVIINKNLSDAGRAEIFSHEAHGHALLYMRNGGDSEGASHQPINGGWAEGNTLLKSMILRSKQETIQNMNR